MHQISEALTLLVLDLLEIVGLVSDQWQIVMISIRILDTKLIIRIQSSVNHLGIIIVSLCLYLVAHVLLENVIWLTLHLL